MSYDVTLPVPAVNQLTTQTTDGRSSEAASMDCGEASVAAITQYIDQAVFLPDEVHDVVAEMTGRAPETIWPTSENDLIGFLAARANISATVHVVTGTGQAMQVIRDAVLDNRPVLALRYFDAIGSKSLHWVVVHGAAGPDLTHTSTVRFMNPWQGVFQSQSNTDFYAWLAAYPSAGQAMLISIDTYPRT